MSSNFFYWKHDLNKFREELKKVAFIPRYQRTPPSAPQGSLIFIRHSHKSGQLTSRDVENVLKGCASQPHGKQLFVCAPLPRIGNLPSPPYGAVPPFEVSTRRQGLLSSFLPIAKKAIKPADSAEVEAWELYLHCQDLANDLTKELERQQAEEQQSLDSELRELSIGSPEAYLKRLLEYSDHEHALAECLRGKFRCWLDESSGRFLLELDVPSFDEITFVRDMKTGVKPALKKEAAVLRERLLCSLVIRMCYLAVKSDEAKCFDVIAVNALQSWRDKSTGRSLKGITASLQASRSDIEALDIEHVDSKMCFLGLRGIRTPNIENVTPIRPIFEFNTEDERVVQAREIIASDDNQNLASMEWEDFEHLVRQLFEWEFGENGAEVRITRASRDRGVDAIMFDPDPIRGGKYVIQAKRYTSTVGVDAVRDLYGTVINEGANRGILVTTSGFGPDAYEFAKAKPISLIDGPNLVAMLKKHGQNYRVDIQAARREMVSEERR